MFGNPDEIEERNSALRHAKALCRFLHFQRAEEITIPVNVGHFVYSVSVKRHFSVDKK